MHPRLKTPLPYAIALGAVVGILASAILTTRHLGGGDIGTRTPHNERNNAGSPARQRLKEATPQLREDLRDLILKARAVYYKSTEEYSLILNRLLDHRESVESLLHLMYREDRADAYLGILCDVASLKSEEFFFELATTRGLNSASRQTSAKIIRTLSRLQSPLLLEHLAAFRAGFGFDNPSHFSDSIFSHLGEWGPGIVPHLADAIRSGKAKGHDLSGAAASMGEVGTQEAADTLYSLFVSDTAPVGESSRLAHGLNRLPKELLLPLFENHMKASPDNPRNNSLIYILMQSPEGSTAAALLSRILRSETIRDSAKLQALIASGHAGRTVATAVFEALVSDSLPAALKGQALLTAAHLARNGRAAYEDVLRAYHHFKEDEDQIHFVDALTQFNSLGQDDGLRRELLAKMATYRSSDSIAVIQLARIEAGLARFDSDPAAALLNLGKHYRTRPDAAAIEAVYEVRKRMVDLVGDPRIDRDMIEFIGAPAQTAGEAHSRAHLIERLMEKSPPVEYKETLLAHFRRQAQSGATSGHLGNLIISMSRAFPESLGELDRIVQSIANAQERRALELLIAQHRKK